MVSTVTAYVGMVALVVILFHAQLTLGHRELARKTALGLIAMCAILIVVANI